MSRPLRAVKWLAVPVGFSATILATEARAVTGPFSWKGYTWKPTMGAVAGVVPADPANVTVDSNGYLHLKIAKNGSAWTAAEVFTSVALGFGTYQWQISGPLDRMDHSVVLGLFPYGPEEGIGMDGTNEIDTEFSFWNDELANVNADWGVYPPTTASMHWEYTFLFSLNGGSSATTRMVWSSTGIKNTLMSGFQPIGATANVLETYDYTPNQPGCGDSSTGASSRDESLVLQGSACKWTGRRNRHCRFSIRSRGRKRPARGRRGRGGNPSR